MYERQYYVYIMMNKWNTTSYIGVTNNLERRIYEHKNKTKDGFTKKYNINKLVFFENFNNIGNAISAEKIIKGWTREKKINLIKRENSNFEDLSDKWDISFQPPSPPCHFEVRRRIPPLCSKNN